MTSSNIPKIIQISCGNLPANIILLFHISMIAPRRVARNYKAECTPDFYLFDGERKLVYHGQLDSSRPGNGHSINGSELREALDAVLNSRPVPGPQKPSIGCGIKWKYTGKV